MSAVSVPPARPPSIPLDQARFAVIDVETSGLSPSRHQILQLAIVIVDAHGHELDQWATFVRPSTLWFRSLGPRRIHGLTRRRLRRAPRLREVMDELARRIDGAVVTAHHVEFDAAFLSAAAARTGTPLDLDRRVCTLQLSRALDPDRGLSHRLADACARYGVEPGRAHDALDDARAASALLPHLLAAHGFDELDQVVAASVRPPRS